MQLDLPTLFHAGVELNLGFGALSFFYEPLRAQVDEAIETIESYMRHYINPSDTPDYDVDAVYEIFRRYREISDFAHRTVVEYLLFDTLISRLAFLGFGLVSFIFLFLTAGDAVDGDSYGIFSIGIVVNVPPIVYVITIFVIGIKYTTVLSPKIRQLQLILFEAYVRTGDVA